MGTFVQIWLRESSLAKRAFLSLAHRNKRTVFAKTYPRSGDVSTKQTCPLVRPVSPDVPAALLTLAPETYTLPLSLRQGGQGGVTNVVTLQKAETQGWMVGNKPKISMCKECFE